jgi:hypothetical protein
MGHYGNFRRKNLDDVVLRHYEVVPTIGVLVLEQRLTHLALDGLARRIGRRMLS